MNIVINGDATNIEHATTVQDLLQQLGYRDAFIAVALNRTCVKRAEFRETCLRAGDEIEILAPMAGG